jgi:NAD(P)-dependent dehydrogenase (short-subunit alcohol dehydrogenase family)
MANTVFITGTSSGIGRATVQHFSRMGWNVAATMRTPEKDTALQRLPGVRLFRLDVLDEKSIELAMQDAIQAFGGIDVVVNNAGYSAVGPFEAATKEQVQKQFDTNVFGVMNVTRAVLPHFRQKRGGVVINITSMGGRITFPVYSIYHATKWAIEGFAESLQYELKPFKIRIKNVEPGAIKTDFYNRSQDLLQKEGLHDYDAYVNATLSNVQEASRTAPGPEVVAQTIYKAATDTSYRLRYVSGNLQTKMVMLLHNILPLSWFRGLIAGIMEKGYRPQVR